MFIDFMEPVAGAVVVSFGLLLKGIAGIIKWLYGGKQGTRRIGDFILPIGSVLLGGVAIWTKLDSGADIVQVLGILSVVLGIGLFVRTYMLYSEQN